MRRKRDFGAEQARNVHGIAIGKRTRYLATLFPGLCLYLNGKELVA